jgi:hypothetical protein
MGHLGGREHPAPGLQGLVTLDSGRRFGWGPGHGGTILRGSSVTAGTRGSAGLVDAADAGDELCRSGGLDPRKVAGKVVLCLRGGGDRVDKSRTVLDAGGLGMILYNTDDVDNLFAARGWRSRPTSMPPATRRRR